MAWIVSFNHKILIFCYYPHFYVCIVESQIRLWKKQAYRQYVYVYE